MENAKTTNHTRQTVLMIAAAFFAVATLRYADDLSEYIVHNVLGHKNYVTHLKK